MSNITRFDPFNDLVDDLFKGFFVRPVPYEARGEVLPRLKVDVAEKNGAYTVTAARSLGATINTSGRCRMKAGARCYRARKWTWPRRTARTR